MTMLIKKGVRVCKARGRLFGFFGPQVDFTQVDFSLRVICGESSYESSWIIPAATGEVVELYGPLGFRRSAVLAVSRLVKESLTALK